MNQVNKLYLSIYLFIYPSIYLHIYLSFYLYIHLSIYLSIYLSICLFSAGMKNMVGGYRQPKVIHYSPPEYSFQGPSYPLKEEGSFYPLEEEVKVSFYPQEEKEYGAPKQPPLYINQVSVHCCSFSKYQYFYNNTFYHTGEFTKKGLGVVVSAVCVKRDG